MLYLCFEPKLNHMARLDNGIMGPLKGKVGTVVCSSWKGIPYVKSLPRERTKPAQKKEAANRQKFALAHQWLQPLLDFVRAGFKGYSEKVEGFNAAKSHLLKNAFQVKDGEMVINPALVKVSVGDLPLPDNITVATAPDQIQFSWDTGSIDFYNQYDQAMVLAYDIDAELTRLNRRIALYELTGQFRSNGAHVLNISPRLDIGTYHCYIAFVSADRSRRSDSVYLGTVTV
jgi:hypothetical protein